MPARKESSTQTAIIRYLRRVGAVVYNNHGSGYTGAGRPDLVACCRGRFIAIEVKREGEQPTKIQLYELDMIRASGGLAFAAWSVADVKQKLEEAGLI